MKIAKGGISWIITSLIINLLFILSSYILYGIFQIFNIIILSFSLLITFILIVFFRDPNRHIGEDIVAVADGKIREIKNLEDGEVGKCINISTFMNLHNVHINRMPIDGKIIKIQHFKGGHIPAFKKESENNERVIILIKTKIGTVKIIQIAGTLARRIVPYIKMGDSVEKGEKIGLIRFGSRVDIYIPSNNIKNVAVKLKDKVIAGEDTIAKIND